MTQLPSTSNLTFKTVGLVGTGAMGRGIAQIAAQAGSVVKLFDTQPEAIAKAIAALGQQWDKLVEKGRLTPEQATAQKSRLLAANALSDFSDCDFVIEAIVERLDVKRTLFADLEKVVRADCVLATNTSSLSVTAIAAGMQHPSRFAGYHFFNPVPLMKVVEVIAGLKTSQTACDQLTAFAKQMGHTPVTAQDTPGFIVNHAGRGYGTEALRIVGENVCDFATVDRILKDQMGFRLGPFELFDLTALDVSHPVMESIYRQYYDEPRYRPSVITAQRLAAGVVGKKVGEGFYKYVDGAIQSPSEQAVPQVAEMPPVWVSPRAARRSELLQLLKDLGAKIETAQSPSASARHAVRRQTDQAPRAGHQPRHPQRHARRRARLVCPRRQSGQRHPRLGRLCHPARGGHHRQHRLRHLPTSHLLPARFGNRRHPRFGLPHGSIGHGQQLGPDEHFGSAL
jgi:3-hydroxybutyryl-CoA dehydrogenase